MNPVRFALVFSCIAPLAASQGLVDATLSQPFQPSSASIVGGAPQGSYNAQFSDDFNRPDAPTLGAN